MASKEANQYRFSGYRMPMVQLDSTGPAYVKLDPHPYFYNQPRFWEGPVFSGHPGGTNNLSLGENKIYPFLEGNENT